MFHSARIKLTVWYSLIIALISLFFSVAIYRVLTSELNRVERIQRLRIERGFPERPNRREEALRPFYLDPQLIKETKGRLGIVLLFIDLTVLGLSAGAGYFLAGRTLKPIGEMIEEQNRFISDASHELRTPLTVLKTEIEVGLRNGNLSLNEARRILESNLEEVDNLQTLSDGLIKLVQYQGGSSRLMFRDLSVTEAAEEALGRVIPLSESKHIKIRRSGGEFRIEGNIF